MLKEIHTNTLLYKTLKPNLPWSQFIRDILSYINFKFNLTLIFAFVFPLRPFVQLINGRDL